MNKLGIAPIVATSLLVVVAVVAIVVYQIWFQNFESELYTQTETTNSNVTKGNALWLYANDKKYAERSRDFIRNYNIKANKSNKISKIFLSSSAIEIRESYETAYMYSSVNTSYFKTEFPNILLYTMVEASKTSMNLLETLSKQEMDSLAEELHQDIKNDTTIDGVHFDLEPHSQTTLQFIKLFTQKTQMPVSVALSHYEDLEIFDVADSVVLMNYAQCVDTKEQFKKTFNRRANKFFNDCKKKNASCSHGILVSETSCEKNNIAQYTNISLTQGEKYESSSDYYAYFALNYRTNKVPDEETISVLLNN